MKTKMKISSQHHNSLILYCHSSENLFLPLLKMLKCSHTVLEIVSEFSDVFWDIVFLSLNEIMRFSANYSLL